MQTGLMPLDENKHPVGDVDSQNLARFEML
jgi:hypothetical protein